MHTYIHTNTYVDIHKYIHTCMNTYYIRAYIHITYVHIHTYLQIYMHTHISFVSTFALSITTDAADKLARTHSVTHTQK